MFLKSLAAALLAAASDSCAFFKANLSSSICWWTWDEFGLLLSLDDLCAAFYLFFGNCKCFIKLIVLDEFEKLFRSCHIATFTNVDEIGFGGRQQRLQS